MTADLRRSFLSTAKNTIIARRFFDDVMARQSKCVVDELIAVDAVVAFPTGWFAGPEGVKRASAQMESAFPDRHVEVLSLSAVGDHVMAEWTLCGTQQRELLGVPPSGRRECVAGHSLFRIEDGKIVEHRMAEHEGRAASA
jgi:predicted ester cyclase